MSVAACVRLSCWEPLFLCTCGTFEGDRLLPAERRLPVIESPTQGFGGMPVTYPVSNPEELSPERLGLVRDHLKDVFASKAFAGSKRAQDFLQLIVEHALAGRLDSLRERAIGAEMFGRRIDYDTANDGVVRVKATEVRRKLAQYYQESTKPPLVRIELPSGSYVPKFHWQSPCEPLTDLQSAPPAPTEPSAIAAPGETFRRPWVVAGMLTGLALIAAIGYIGFKVWPRESPPEPEHHTIAVLPLQNLSGDPGQNYFADSMTEELIADLGQVSASRVISRTSTMTYKGTTKTLPPNRPRVGSGYRGRRFRAAPGQSSADHRPVDRCPDRPSPLGSRLRPQLERRSHLAGRGGADDRRPDQDCGDARGAVPVLPVPASSTRKLRSFICRVRKH